MISVLLVSADPEFASTVMARWQTERTVPAFVTLGDNASPDAVISTCDLAITGPSPSDSLVAILRSLDAASRPAICLVSDSATASTLRQANSRVITLREHEGWVDNLVVVAGEVIRRMEAGARARRAETALSDAQVNATLGKFMLDMRHGLNNALTSILGNSELLLLEPGALSVEHRDQVETMHNMALRIHETLQRFTSLEMEMKLYSQSHHEMPLTSRNVIPISASRPDSGREDGVQAAHRSGVS